MTDMPLQTVDYHIFNFIFTSTFEQIISVHVVAYLGLVQVLRQ